MSTDQLSEPAATAPTEQPRSTRVRSWIFFGSLGLALLLLVGVVWGLGGFEPRRDRITGVPPGTTVSTGEYEVTFTSVTVQRVLDKGEDEVIAIGTARTNGDKTISATTGEEGFVYAQNRDTREVQPVSSYRYGDSTDIILANDALTPGLPPINFTATFTFEQRIDTDTVRVVVFDQEFSDRSVFGDQDPKWNRIEKGVYLSLPVTRLADRKF